MVARYVLNINSNDELHQVIQKCNTNFKSLATQIEMQSNTDSSKREADKSEIEGMIAEAVSSLDLEISALSDSLVHAIDDERDARSAKDDDIDRAINGIRDDYAKRADLSAVATSGNYTDLLNRPFANNDSAYVTFGSENPGTALGGTWTQVGSIAVGSESLNVWKKTS